MKFNKWGDEYEVHWSILLQQLGPSFVKESPHAVAGLSNLWIILIKFFTVLKNKIHVHNEAFQIQVPVITRKKFKLNSLQA